MQNVILLFLYFEEILIENMTILSTTNVNFIIIISCARGSLGTILIKNVTIITSFLFNSYLY